jgi:phosphate transport system permease protein
MITQAPNYNRRKWVDRFMRGLTIAATGLALVPLFLILGYVVVRGAGALNLDFFTKAYEPPVVEAGGTVGNAGGILHGIVGSLLIVGVAMLIALPIGLLAGVFLAEYPANSVATFVRFCTDVLSAAPSIIIGVVAYVLIVQRTRQFSGLAGSIALAVLMVPVITRTTEEILKLVPQGMREAAMALGAPKWRLTLTVVIPTALSGIVTGALLAFARATGETAPLLLTVLGNNNVSFNLLAPMAALPLLTYKYTDTPFPAQNTLAWGTALILTLLVLSVNILVRWATRNRLQ